MGQRRSRAEHGVGAVPARPELHVRAVPERRYAREERPRIELLYTCAPHDGDDPRRLSRCGEQAT